LQASAANIYAAGDVCESFDLAMNAPGVNALWPVAVEQGKIAGANIAGERLNYGGSLGMNSLEFFGLPVVSLGIYKAEEGDSSFEELKSSNPGENKYKKLIMKNNRLLGAVLVGEIKNSGVFLRLIREKIDISGFKDALLEDNFGYPAMKDALKERDKVYV
jgi:NAD(P)H-nitrite reductase large subunit